jgi:hypothetical protein
MGDIGVDGTHLQTVFHPHTTLKKFPSKKEETYRSSDNEQ